MISIRPLLILLLMLPAPLPAPGLDFDCGDQSAARDTRDALHPPRRLFDYRGPEEKEQAAIRRRTVLFQHLLGHQTLGILPIALTEPPIDAQWNYLLAMGVEVGAFTLFEVNRSPGLGSQPGAFVRANGGVFTIALNVFDWSQDPELTAGSLITYGYVYLRLREARREATSWISRLSRTTRDHLASHNISGEALNECLATRAEEESLMRLYAGWRQDRKHPEMRTLDLEARLARYRDNPTEYLVERLQAHHVLPTRERYVLNELLSTELPSGWLPALSRLP